MSSKSHSVYTNALQVFNNFRNYYNLTITWPVPVAHLSLFITYCFELGYASSTITTYLSAISFHHKIYDMLDPTTAFVVKKLLEGCRRIRPSYDVRAPITELILARICSVLPEICFSNYECILFKAAFVIAYYGLLRVGEIVFTNPLQANRPLLRTDVWLGEGANVLFISIRVSKTNQSGHPTILRIPLASSATICCVTVVKQYMRFRPEGTLYFFCHQNGHPLKRSQFSSILAKAVKKLGLPMHLYATHSFRIGRATDLAARGYSSAAIKLLGRWKTGAVTRYIRL